MTDRYHAAYNTCMNSLKVSWTSADVRGGSGVGVFVLVVDVCTCCSMFKVHGHVHVDVKRVIVVHERLAASAQPAFFILLSSAHAL